MKKQELKTKVILKKKTNDDPKKEKLIRVNKDGITEKVSRKEEKAPKLQEVISHREIKYVYPENCVNTLERKKFRQKARNRWKTLQLELIQAGNDEKKLRSAQKALSAFEKEIYSK